MRDDAYIMYRKKLPQLSNTRKRIVFIISAFLLFYLVSYVIDPFAPYWQNYFDRSVYRILGDQIPLLSFCILISESSILISKKLNKRIPWTERPVLRLLIEAGCSFLIVLIVNLSIDVVYSLIMREDSISIFVNNLSIEQRRGILQWIVVSSMIAFMIIGINTGDYLLQNWKNAAVKAAELNQLAMETELQALKLQIDPHFVFNNLSVLSELILKDQQLGYDYAENFSKIYRYMLVSSRKDVISLEDELKFLNSYIFLLKQRAGEGVQFEINVNKEYRQLFMPPLTLQLLVENALKHNKTLKTNPLKISIYTNNKEELIVENVLAPIENTIDSSGIGIRNIIRRYSLLAEKQPEIVKDAYSFKVIIPLIKYDQ